jgi:hypothetical protein
VLCHCLDTASRQANAFAAALAFPEGAMTVRPDELK